MECKDSRELIARYSSGDLEVLESNRLEAHIADCVECEEYLSQSESLWNLLDEPKEIEPDDNYIARFWGKVEQDEIRESSGLVHRLKNFKLNWNFAGALATICIVSVFTFALIRDDFSREIFVDSDVTDEQLLEDLDMAITRDTSEVLAIYGPWDNVDIDNAGEMN